MELTDEQLRRYPSASSCSAWPCQAEPSSGTQRDPLRTGDGLANGVSCRGIWDRGRRSTCACTDGPSRMCCSGCLGSWLARILHEQDSKVPIHSI